MKFDLEILDTIESSQLETYDPLKIFKGLKLKIVSLHKKRASLLVKYGDSVKRLTLSENLTRLAKTEGWTLNDTLNNSVIIVNGEGIPFLSLKPDIEGGWETI